MDKMKEVRYYSICFEITGKCLSEDECERISCVTWYVTEKTYNDLLDLLQRRQEKIEP